MALSPHNHKLKSESGKLVPKSCPQVTQNHHFVSKCSTVENDFDVESWKDYDSVKCDMNSKIDSNPENANEDDSWDITAINGMIRIVFTQELLHRT